MSWQWDQKTIIICLLVKAILLRAMLKQSRCDAKDLIANLSLFFGGGEEEKEKENVGLRLKSLDWSNTVQMVRLRPTDQLLSNRSSSSLFNSSTRTNKC